MSLFIQNFYMIRVILMKKVFITLSILLIFIIRCNDSNNKVQIEDPKKFAQLTLEIANAGNHKNKLTKVYKKYGLNLIDGTQMYNEIYKKISSDPENYQIFQKELLELMKKQSIENNKTQTNDKSEQEKK